MTVNVSKIRKNNLHPYSVRMAQAPCELFNCAIEIFYSLTSIRFKLVCAAAPCCDDLAAIGAYFDP